MVQLMIQMINVFILSFAIGYILSPMISRMLTKRKDQIADSLRTARMSKEEALAQVKMYEEKLTYFEEEREALLERAGQKANVREDEIIGEALAEAERIKNRAGREAALLWVKVKDDLKNDMIAAAAAAAGKLIAENMDEKDLVRGYGKAGGEKLWTGPV